jgi:hypothetical protein
MQSFVEKTELCREINKEEIKMSQEIGSDIDKVIAHDFEQVVDIIGVLRFAHNWKMTTLYNLTINYIRNELFEIKHDIFDYDYDINIMKSVVCKEIWRDIFKTTDDINKVTFFGKLWALQTAHENGCPWNKWTAVRAAESGNLNCLKYVHENECPWDELTCTRAASFGRLNCLKYAHENGCPWDEMTLTQASKNGHLSCLKYAHENGCPWNDKTHLLSANYNCIKYINENIHINNRY